MKLPSFEDARLGTPSIALGGVALVLCYITFIYNQQIVLFYVGPAVSLVGIVLGVLAIKTPRGVIGVVLNTLPLVFLLSVFLSILNLTLLSM